MDEKRVIEVDEYQHGLIINSLNDKRNELVEQGKDTEFVDDTLIEVMEAPTKREKKKHRDERDR
ncbi:MAG: hypothetical protein VB034_00765 [Eubacteriales bacterium]|nr:hypothetical protein [Eubacteriales bacterium]